MELKTDLSKPGRARLLRSVGKRTRRSKTDESDLTDSVRDFESMPSAQTTMGGRAAPRCAANRLQRRTRPSSTIAAFASDTPSETAEFGRRGAAAFPHRVRGFALFRCCAYRASKRPFAAPRPTHTARTGSCAAALNGAGWRNPSPVGMEPLGSEQHRRRPGG